MDDGATYKIGQAADMVGVKTYVLRFWEGEFEELEPIRTPSGQRLYADEHIALLRRIRKLLHEDGLTIEGARKQLAMNAAEEAARPPSALLREIEAELLDIQRLLKA